MSPAKATAKKASPRRRATSAELTTVEKAMVGHDPATVREFLDQARVLAEWHRDRTQAIETKAGIVLGFAGVMLTVLPVVAEPITKLTGNWKGVAVGLALDAGGLLLASAIAGLLVLTVRESRFSKREQVVREWQSYRDGPERSEAQVAGLFADQLLSGSNGEKSPIDSLADDADKRARWLRWSIRLLGAAFILLAGMAGLLLIEAATR